MKSTRIKQFILFSFVLIFGITLGFLVRHNQTSWTLLKKPIFELYNYFFDNNKTKWNRDFELVEIKSKIDNKIQKAYLYKTKSQKKKPLVVSLHAWFGNYSKFEQLADFCKQKDINYIHPDFRGPNTNKDACCSDLAINDIEESITFAIKNANVDTSEIYIIGFSGGGYAALCTFIKSKYNIKKISVWAPISNLEAWYNECKITNNKYVTSILNCTESSNMILNEKIARNRSPLLWNIPANKYTESQINIYAGSYDGIVGEVPITHSINFYNKLLAESKVIDTSSYITNYEKNQLLEYRKPLGSYDSISNRKVFLVKKHNNFKITIYEGHHEFFSLYALNELLK